MFKYYRNLFVARIFSTSIRFERRPVRYGQHILNTTEVNDL